MRDLSEGIRHFRSRVFEPRRLFFENLAQGQSPGALFITCSDSRIDPNLITGCEPGELFVLRNVGNLVPAYGTNSGGVDSAIEYAVAVLGVEDVVICGHTRCGAVQGLLDPEALRDLPAVRSWLSFAGSTTLRLLKERRDDEAGSTAHDVAVETNVLAGLELLQTHPIIIDRLARGLLRLHGWVYRLETGELTSWDAANGRFWPIGPEEFARMP